MSIFLKIKGLICIVFAIATLVVPNVVAPLYNFDFNFTSMYFANMFGVCFLGIGLICWMASNSAASKLKQSILLSLAIADTAGFGFSLYHQLTGTINALGWTTVILWLFVAAGCWYYRLSAKE
jgi:hypothetical protein